YNNKVKIILWNNADKEKNDSDYEEEEWEIEYEPHYYLENDTQFMNIDETYLIEIPPWGEPATGLEFMENATENRNCSIESSFPFNKSWNMETIQDSFDKMEIEAKEWVQPFDEYIDWEAYDSM
ncbi:11667_t:CDS:2, partial [Gigaspora rosea]